MNLHEVAMWISLIGIAGGLVSEWKIWRTMRDLGSAGILIYLAGVLLAEGILDALGMK